MSSAMFVQTNSYLDNLKRDFPNHAPLVLLYMWDIIRDVFTDIEGAIDGDSSWGDIIIVPGTKLEDVWDRFIKDPWGGFDLDEGNVVDWLSSEDFIQDWEGDEVDE
jgi:hypothetical protein